MQSSSNNILINCSCCGNQQGKLIHENLSSVYSDDPWNIVECLSCENLITIPEPSPKLLNHIYSEIYLYPVHLLVLGEKKLRAKSLANYIIKNIKIAPQEKLFEAGCMYGYFLDAMKDQMNVKGIEIGKESVGYCRANGLDVSDMSIETFLSAPGENYDLFVLSHVFEHLLHPEIILDYISQRINENGKIIISVPNSKSICRKLFGKAWGWWQVPVHINHFCKSSLEKIAASKNLIVTDVRYRGGDSLMLLLNLMNLFGYHGKNGNPGVFQKTIIRLFTLFFRYWYFIGNEEITVVLSKSR